MNKSDQEGWEIFEIFLTLFTCGIYLLIRFLQGDRFGERIGCATIGGIVTVCLVVVYLIYNAGAEMFAIFLCASLMTAGGYLLVRVQKSELKKLEDQKSENYEFNRELDEMPDPTQEEIDAFHAWAFKKLARHMSDEAAAYTLKKYSKSQNIPLYMDVIAEFDSNQPYLYCIESWPTDTMRIDLH